MKLYLVWTGEYEDTTLVGIFQSKEKAEHYIKLHDEIDGAGVYCSGYYMTERVTDDEKIDLDDTVSKYYYARISCEGEDEGVIETDEDCDEFIRFLAPYTELTPETLNPALYTKIIEDMDRDVYETEEQYYMPVEKFVTGEDVIVHVFARPLQNEKKMLITDITVYSKNSYAEARRIVIEKYREFQEQVKNNPEAKKFYNCNLLYNENDPYGLTEIKDDDIWV